MNTLPLAVIVIVGIVLFVALAKSKAGPSEFPYQLSKYLLSKAERSFYGVLVQAIGKTGLVFSKIRVADVITPKKGLNRSDWQRAFNAVSSKHFDFLVCDPTDCSIKLAIELDDASHSTAKSQKRDSLLNGACESAGLPLLRIKAAKEYVVAEIQRQVEETISPWQDVPAPSTVVQALVSEPMVSEVISADEPTSKLSLKQDSGPVEKPIPAVAREDEPASPTCPKCGEPMLRRNAKSGSNAGQEFWGCRAFPKCRAVVKVDA
jgi:very-short-patch-repair endonuclease|tara:strand:- start:7679 stop:8467 length:789 start_codon:yes stop_codon:yes gene_type:complete